MNVHAIFLKSNVLIGWIKSTHIIPIYLDGTALSVVPCKRFYLDGGVLGANLIFAYVGFSNSSWSLFQYTVNFSDITYTGNFPNNTAGNSIKIITEQICNFILVQNYNANESTIQFNLWAVYNRSINHPAESFTAVYYIYFSKNVSE